MFEDYSLFLSNVMIAAKQVGILYLLALVGVVADKAKIFTESTAKKCTDLLFYIITPGVIINSFFTTEFSKESATNLLISVGCGFLLHFVAIIITKPFFRKGNLDENVIYKYGAIYGNVGYLTLPLTNAVLGSEGVFYCAGVVMAFNVMCFTHGIILMDTESRKFDFKKLFLNPGVIGVVIGLPFYLFNIDLPELITAPVAYIDAVQTPVAMIIFGTYLANSDLKTIFKNKNIFITAFLKLVLLPAAMFVIYKLFGLTGTLICALMISSCAPSANNTVMFSAKYGKDTGIASQTVSVVSFLSIISMPLIIAFVSTFAG